MNDVPGDLSVNAPAEAQTTLDNAEEMKHIEQHAYAHGAQVSIMYSV
jgi:hypothetical protein